MDAKIRIFCIACSSTLFSCSPVMYILLSVVSKAKCYPWQLRKSLFLEELHAVCNYKWGWAWSLPTVPMPQHRYTHVCPNGNSSQTEAASSCTPMHSVTVESIQLNIFKTFFIHIKVSWVKIMLALKRSINDSIHGPKKEKNTRLFFLCTCITELF